MKKRINFLPLMIFLLVTLAFWHLEAKAQTYLPVGPQTNVPVATVTGGGWTECYRDLYNFAMNASTVLSACPGSRLMLACRTTGSSTLTLLAQGNRSDVTFDTGNNSSVTHSANGVGWYFNTTRGSWGYVRNGDSVSKENCDVDLSGANDERLCWHIDAFIGGWRCGKELNLWLSEDFERIVYEPSPLPIPTLNQWGMIIMAAVLGLFAVIGLFVMRTGRTVAGGRGPDEATQ